MRYAIGLVALILAVGYVGQDDYEESIRQEQQYCEMVAVWKADAARGIPANDRAGWPPFDGECK
jgi:hypothetical protein|nr:MAG TPA: hypothetical protein [Caudoviricetes sp.]